ncbi:hypothetical protein DRQ20_04260 [bacterium]|nr:MAG: hypothetical protein DRQ20_04260 [bacterium]
MILLLFSKSVKTAVFLSLLLPGGGQFYTGNYLKGIAIGGIEVYCFYRCYQGYAEGNEDEGYTYLFWSLITLLFSAADAYVDANLYGIKPELEVNPEEKSVSLRLKIQ